MTPVDELRRYYEFTERAFARLAPYYDLVAIPLVGVRDRVVQFSEAAPGATVLDVATGTGAQAFAFARRGHPVVGVDISEDMLVVARRKNRFPHARFMRADATQLPFRDGTFGVAIVSYALHDMPPGVRERVLHEMKRVVRPGGTIVVVDYGRPAWRPWRRVLHGLIGLYEGEYFRSFVDGDLAALLADAGLVIEADRQVRLGIARMVRARVGPAAALSPAD